MPKRMLLSDDEARLVERHRIKNNEVLAFNEALEYACQVVDHRISALQSETSVAPVSIDTTELLYPRAKLINEINEIIRAAKREVR